MAGLVENITISAQLKLGLSLAKKPETQDREREVKGIIYGGKTSFTF